MKTMLIGLKNGRKCWKWSAVLGLVLVVHAVVIGVAEAVWYAMSGGVSPLLAGFGFMASWLILVRLLGEAMVSSAHEMDSVNTSHWN